MSDAFVFGYGSLVNRRTHDYRGARPARLPGWRRAWQHAEGREVAFLAAVPATPGVAIEGVIARVPGDDWTALDEREASYERAPAHGLEHDGPEGLDISIYRVPTDRHRVSPVTQQILLSYVDVVVQGYLEIFGPAGVARFFTSTDGWDAMILDDRAQPRYRRHQTTSEKERELTDRWLDQLGCRRRPDERG